MSRGGRRKARTVADARARIAELEERAVVSPATPGALWIVATTQLELRQRAADALLCAHRQGHFEPGGLFSPTIAVGSTS